MKGYVIVFLFKVLAFVFKYKLYTYVFYQIVKLF